MATFETAIEFFSLENARDGQATARGRVFFDPATEDETDIIAAAESGFPNTYLGYFLASIRIDATDWNSCTVEGLYKSLPLPDTSGSADPEYAFEVGTESQHILAARAVVSSGAKTGKAAPNNKGLIGATAEGVAGCDILVPVASFSEVHHFTAATITEAQQVAWALNYVAHVHSGAATFRGFAAGEVLCTGISGNKRGTDLWSLRFGFAVRPNRASIVIGDLTIPALKGWEYLELHFEDVEDNTNKLLLQQPYAYTIHRPYENQDFNSSFI